MKLLRTLPTNRLLALLVLIAALVVGGTAIAVAAGGGGGPTPAPKALADAIHDALAATEPDGITARITFTNNLFPSGALAGNVGSALMSGATGRLWATNDGRGRLELQSNAGDVQIVWSGEKVTIYDASSNTVYEATLPAQKDTSTADKSAPPALSEITDFLTKLADHWAVSDANPDNVAGEPAYTVSVSPKHDGGLLGSLELSWDAANGTPLRIAVLAQGSSTPALALAATDIGFGSVPDSAVDIAPPSGAKVVDLGAQAGGSTDKQSSGKDVSGLDAVQAAVPFPISAPATLVGLPRKDVTLIGPADSQSVLVLYGQGLGGIAITERAADAKGSNGTGMLGALPTVSLDGVTAHELATQLGTVIQWDKGGVSFTLAGSLPAAAAETAARALG